MTRLAVGTLVAVLLASVGFAQVRWNDYRRNRMPPRFRPAGHRDNGFTFCRLMYTSVRRESAGRGWRTDYPAADVNFMIRLSELTSTTVDFDDGEQPKPLGGGDHRPRVVQLPVRDDLRRRHDGAERRRGGAVARLPGEGRLPVGRRLLGHPGLDPMGVGDRPRAAAIRVSHHRPAARSRAVQGASSISGRCRRSPTSAFGDARAEPRHQSEATTATRRTFRAITDKHGRIMVAMTHNTDIQDAWEREGEDPRFFREFGPDGYSLGVNVAALRDEPLAAGGTRPAATDRRPSTHVGRLEPAEGRGIRQGLRWAARSAGSSTAGIFRSWRLREAVRAYCHDGSRCDAGLSPRTARRSARHPGLEVRGIGRHLTVGKMPDHPARGVGGPV